MGVDRSSPKPEKSRRSAVVPPRCREQRRRGAGNSDTNDCHSEKGKQRQTPSHRSRVTGQAAPGAPSGLEVRACVVQFGGEENHLSALLLLRAQLVDL